MRDGVPAPPASLKPEMRKHLTSNWSDDAPPCFESRMIRQKNYRENQSLGRPNNPLGP